MRTCGKFGYTTLCRYETWHSDMAIEKEVCMCYGTLTRATKSLASLHCKMFGTISLPITLDTASGYLGSTSTASSSVRSTRRALSEALAFPREMVRLKALAYF